MTKKKWGILVKFICIVLTFTMAFSIFAGCDDDDRSSKKDKDKEESIESGAGGDRKKIALTFDDGPHNVRTTDIVDELNKYGYHATFFVVGNRIDGTEYNGSAGLKYAHEAGNEIGIHGYTHNVYYDECTKEEFESELNKTKNAIHNVIPDAKIRLMRPVGGYITDERVKQCPYSVIMWSVDSNDYNYTYKKGDTEKEWKEKVDTIVDNVMKDLDEGDIILMHDLYESTYDATVILLKRLYEEGYEVVTVSELLNNPPAGQKFSRAGQNKNHNSVG